MRRRFRQLAFISSCLLAVSCGLGEEPAPKKHEEISDRSLRETIIAKVSLPEQTMAERIAELERMARQAGVDESKLKFVWTKTAGAEKAAELRVEPLKRENMSLRDILVWSMGNSFMRIEARGKTVLISHGAEGPDVLVPFYKTILPKVSLPEQDLTARIAELTRMARQAGVDESKMKLVWTKEGSEKAGKFHCEAIKAEDLPLRDLLDQSIEAAPVRLHFEDDTVFIRHEAEPWPDE